MEAVSSSQTSVNIYQTAQCYIPEDSHLQVNYLILKATYVYFCLMCLVYVFFQVMALQSYSIMLFAENEQ
jgi:hypothetical protein